MSDRAALRSQYGVLYDRLDRQIAAGEDTSEAHEVIDAFVAQHPDIADEGDELWRYFQRRKLQVA